MAQVGDEVPTCLLDPVVIGDIVDDHQRTNHLCVCSNRNGMYEQVAGRRAKHVDLAFGSTALRCFCQHGRGGGIDQCFLVGSSGSIDGQTTAHQHLSRTIGHDHARCQRIE